MTDKTPQEELEDRELCLCGHTANEHHQFDQCGKDGCPCKCFRPTGRYRVP